MTATLDMKYLIISRMINHGPNPHVGSCKSISQNKHPNRLGCRFVINRPMKIENIMRYQIDSGKERGAQLLDTQHSGKWPLPEVLHLTTHPVNEHRRKNIKTNHRHLLRNPIRNIQLHTVVQAIFMTTPLHHAQT